MLRSRRLHLLKLSVRCGRVCGRPIPQLHVLVLLLASLLLRRFRRSIAFAETLPTVAITSLDEARREVVRAAVAAHELLCLRLVLSLAPGQWSMLSFGRLGLLSARQFRVPLSL